MSRAAGAATPSRPPAPPEALPIFPLTGVLLLPGGRLPLYFFEERYCNLAEDVAAGDRCIGVVQPRHPRPDDNRGLGDGDATPEIYPVGCVGWIEHMESLPHGRFVVLLRGWCRFRVLRELSTRRGYRRVLAEYAEFDVDQTDVDTDLASAPLLAALRRFGRDHRVEIEMDELGEVAGLDLMNSIAMALPFQPAEKQALLEAPDVRQRHEMLLALLDMGVDLEQRPTIAH